MCVELLIIKYLFPLQASVLQHAAEHIYRANQERERLIQQNTTLRMMLTKHFSTLNSGDPLSENKVNKATSPMMFDEEKAAAKELEQIFAAQKELDRTRTELAREREIRRRLEAKFGKASQEIPPSDDEEQDRNVTTGTFRPISAGADSTRVSPVTPVCAS